METFVKVIKALSDPSRVIIIKLLQHKSMCVCELTSALGLSQPTVSKHLKVLEGAGLVGFAKDERWVNYYLADGGKSPYAASLLGNLKHWLEDDPAISELVKRLPEINREDICSR